VIGVVVQRDGTLAPSTILADWVIGADGAYSVVARLLAHESRITRLGQHRTATMYTYLPCKDDAFHWLFESPRRGQHGRTAGVIPSHDGKACVFFSSHPDEFASYRRSPVDSMKDALASMSHPDLPELTFPRGNAGLHLRYFQGRNGFMRECIGRGWALVGDAGYFKDPSTAHGISDALRDAELIAHSILGGSEQAYRSYPEQRDELSTRLFDITCRIASLDCDNEELAQLHVALSKEMKREVEFMSDLPSLVTRGEAAA
jgi:flavin-dependent dehydrogenase